MTSEKFPEAFNRFKRKYDVTEKNFSEIIKLFEEWQKDHMNYVSGAQKNAIADCLKNPISNFWTKAEIHYKYGIGIRYRNKKTGRFVKPSWYE